MKQEKLDRAIAIKSEIEKIKREFVLIDSDFDYSNPTGISIQFGGHRQIWIPVDLLDFSIPDAIKKFIDGFKDRIAELEQEFDEL